MNKAIRKVEEFHDVFGLSIQHTPEIPDDWTQGRRYNLIHEEVVEELLPAMKAKDMVKIADGIGDAIFVLIGTALEYGIPLDHIFTEICRSNMSKKWLDEPHIRKRADGKILKPPTYSPADIAGVLKNFK